MSILGSDLFFIGMALAMADESKRLGNMPNYARLLLLANYLRIMATVVPDGEIELDKESNLSPEAFAQVETMLLDSAAACRNARMQLIFEKETNHGS